MAASVASLKALYGPTSRSDADLAAFVAMANTLQTEVLLNTGLSSTRLDQIANALAAHFLTISEERGGITRQRLGEADESYVDPTRSGNMNTYGLSTTRFGAMALMLDTSGVLSALINSSNARAEFRVI